MRVRLRSTQQLVALVASLAVTTPAMAQVGWTDWTAEGSTPSGTPTVSGTMLFGSTPIGVTYTGPYSFAQLGCGGDYYQLATYPNTYTGGTVTNGPPGCDLIGLGQGGLKTITFSAPVTNPLIAFVSWNGQPDVAFSGPLQIVGSSNCGYWGCGAIVLTNGNMNFTSPGEFHGTLRVLGTYSTISFTDASEGWHGITVGAEALAPTTAPEPASLLLTATGLLGLAAALRRRRA